MSASQKHPYVRFFVSDWLGGTRGMRATEIGIYITLLSLMYDRGAPLADDRRRLARQCGCTVPVLAGTLELLIDEGKIEQTDAGLWNKRVAREFMWRAENAQQSREAAESRWKKPNKNNGPSMRPQCERTAVAMPFQSPESEPDEDIGPEGPCGPAEPREAVRSGSNGSGDPHGSEDPNASDDANGPERDASNDANGPERKGSRSPPLPVKQAFVHYNIAARQLGLPLAQKLTADRRRKLRARLSEHGLEGWDRALIEIERSAFLRGENASGWRVSLDFLLSPSKLNKVIDGGYSDHDP